MSEEGRHSHGQVRHEHDGGGVPHNHDGRAGTMYVGPAVPGTQPPARRRGSSGLTGTGIALIILGVTGWLVTNSLVSQCRSEMDIFSGPGICSGLPVIAWHLQAGLTIAALVCTGIGAAQLISGMRRRD